MNELHSAGSGFIGYEYKSITIGRDMESRYADGYASFGWSLVGTDTKPAPVKSDTVKMKFKRDRKIRNKAELTRLQRQFEACAEEIQSMERSKTSSANMAAYVIGLVGTALMAGSVFAYMDGLFVPSIVLAVPGFLFWLIPHPAYQKVKQYKSANLLPFIEQKYDELYEACEKASNLLRDI